MNYSKLSDQEINGLVMDALSDGNQAYRNGDGSFIELIHQVNAVEFGEHVERDEFYATFDPCNNPADAWPIIVQNRIGLNFVNGNWRAQSLKTGWVEFCHENPLQAAMTVFILMQERQHA